MSEKEKSEEKTPAEESKPEKPKKTSKTECPSESSPDGKHGPFHNEGTDEDYCRYCGQ